MKAQAVQKKVLFLPIEIVERELDGKLLLAEEALSRGYTVCIGDYRKLPSYAKDLQFGYYLHKAHTDHRSDVLFQPLHSLGVHCGALDEEGLVFPSFSHYIHNRLGTGKSLLYLSHLFTWGEIQKENIDNVFPSYKDKVFSTGNTRIDLLREPYRSLFCDKTRIITQQHEKFILINTNFGVWNSAPSAFGMSFTEHMIKYGYAKTPEEIAKCERRVAYYKALYSDYVEMIKTLAPQVYPTKIILRPHPAENQDTWRESLNDIPNVQVLFQGAATDWIKASICMIHAGCTTGIEGFVLDKPVLRYNPRYDSDFESDLPNMIGKAFSDISSLTAEIGSILAGTVSGYNTADQYERLLPWIKNLKGQHAAPQMMNIIDMVDNSGTDVNKILSSEKKVLIKKIKKVLKRIILLAMGRSKKEKSISGKTKKQFTGIPKASILYGMRLLLSLRESSNRYNYSVIKIEDNVYLLSKKRKGNEKRCTMA